MTFCKYIIIHGIIYIDYKLLLRHFNLSSQIMEWPNFNFGQKKIAFFHQCCIAPNNNNLRKLQATKSASQG